MHPKEKLIEALNSDLKNELKHWNFYMQSYALIRGMHRNHLRSFLQDAAKEEQTHIQEFADLIVGLGGKPSFEFVSVNRESDADTIIGTAILFEEEVVNNYVERMAMAEELGGADGRWVTVFLEDQLEASRKDLDNLRMMSTVRDWTIEKLKGY